MLPRLLAERQLHAIEVASVPHMKPEAVKQVMRRYRRQLDGVTHKKKAASEALLDAFREAGLPVKEVDHGG